MARVAMMHRGNGVFMGNGGGLDDVGLDDGAQGSGYSRACVEITQRRLLCSFLVSSNAVMSWGARR